MPQFGFHAPVKSRAPLCTADTVSFLRQYNNIVCGVCVEEGCNCVCAQVLFFLSLSLCICMCTRIASGQPVLRIGGCECGKVATVCASAPLFLSFCPYVSVHMHTKGANLFCRSVADSEMCPCIQWSWSSFRIVAAFAPPAADRWLPLQSTSQTPQGQTPADQRAPAPWRLEVCVQ